MTGENVKREQNATYIKPAFALFWSTSHLHFLHRYGDIFPQTTGLENEK